MVDTVRNQPCIHCPSGTQIGLSGFSSACVDDITQLSSLRPFSIHDEANRTLYLSMAHTCNWISIPV